MPERLKTFLTGLSDQERAVMEEVFMKNLGKYKSYEEVKAAVEAKSPELAAKLYQPTSWLDEKAAALGPEARAYYNARPTDAELKQSMVEDVNGYRALSAAGKADFQKQFPVLAKFLGNGSEDGELLLEILLGAVGQGLVLVDGALGLLLQLGEVGLVAGDNLGLDLAGSGDDLQKVDNFLGFLDFYGFSHLLSEGLGLISEGVDLSLHHSVQLLGLLTKFGPKWGSNQELASVLSRDILDAVERSSVGKAQEGGDGDDLTDHY
ncbi:nematode fatty acid retinoid binding protein [Ancylostoma ceylanicum]|uniref:Nematode fatty acid retinoid binding protein n=1 Tax=Ancylostoma ceylanicum TaxID=53326 RepID=A0A0D6M7A1_9BILA|nr:nematode fatty acid retinoid binding protein [Ancylostoma ceylanicum]